MPDLSVIIVNHLSGRFLGDCLASLCPRVDTERAEVIVVDNGPHDPALDGALARCAGVRLLRCPDRPGFGEANNAGARDAAGAHLLFLNPDTVVPRGAVEELLSFARMRDCDAVGPRLVDGDGALEISHAPDPGLLGEGSIRLLRHLGPLVPAVVLGRGRAREVDWLTAAALLVRTPAFRDVGGFDEGYPLYFEDADLCRRLRDRGGSCWFLPTTCVTHLRGRSTGAARQGTPQLSAAAERKYRAGQLRYYARHRGALHNAVLRRYLRRRFRGSPELLSLLDEPGGPR
jgi:GT2 family glycosyltransferase